MAAATCPDAVIVCTIIILNPFIGSTLSRGVAGGVAGRLTGLFGAGAAEILKIIRSSKIFLPVFESIYFKISSFKTRPLSPVPLIRERSISFSAAIFLTAGVANTSPLPLLAGGDDVAISFFDVGAACSKF